MGNLKEKIEELKVKTSQVYLCLKSPKTPWYAKAIAALTVAYALSPIDLIPDFIPILGYLDDLVILPFLIWLTAKLVPKDVWSSFEEEAKGLWQDGKPKKWYFAIPIIVIWLAVIAVVTVAILQNTVWKQ